MAGDVGKVVRLVPGLADQMQVRPSEPVRINEQSDEQFGDLFSKMINSVNNAQVESGEIQSAFLAGEPVELHQVMIKAEKAGVATDLLLEVRNKLVDGINEIMRMPV